jgi:hypothetical protein
VRKDARGRRSWRRKPKRGTKGEEEKGYACLKDPPCVEIVLSDATTRRVDLVEVRRKEK